MHLPPKRGVTSLKGGAKSIDLMAMMHQACNTQVSEVIEARRYSKAWIASIGINRDQ